ncbi:MAG: hypothetical protein ACOYMA_05930 [Bacteroidia bacterium]|jgi:glycosyltransferase involved in cell wall biosynthesis
MKILFITYATAEGRGGHVHSMLQISNFISEFNDVRTMNLGNGDSCVLKNSKNFIGSCNIVDLKNILRLNQQFANKLNDFNPDVIHCFDEYSYFLATHSTLFFHKKFVFTKCGGPSSKHKFWFHSDTIVLFSKENYNWYQNKKQYRNSSILLIPNRVKSLSVSELNSYGLTKDSKAFNFLRIGRIGENYKNSILSLIKLVHKLKSDFVENKKINVYIIGYVESENIFQEITNYSEELNINTYFITDDRTIHASQLLGLADCVLGTGRGLMEAMSLSIPVITPVSNNTYPVLVTQKNFKSLLETNFSPRNYLSDINSNEELSIISKIIKSENNYQTIKDETFKLFNEYLSLDSSKNTYKTLYANASKRKKSYHLINTVYLLKYIIQFLWT